MKIQEQVVIKDKGQEYWNIFFEFQSTRALTKFEWSLIYNKIDKMIYEFEKKADNE